MSRGKVPVCRLCGDTRVRALGRIPDCDYFAGRVLHEPMAGGDLWRCESCHSMFRHPVLKDEQYLGLYQQGEATQWSGGEHRLDGHLISSLLTRRAGLASVLDIGCGTGDFLASLPPHIARFGVEPAATAAKRAAARGICVIASTLPAVPANTVFDAVTMIDVLEHMPHPSDCLSQGFSHVAPGGVLVVSTGDPENAFWQNLFRSRFWYCGFPEHVSFPSLRFFQHWSENSSGAQVSKQAFRYQRLRAGNVILGSLMQLVYFMSPRAFSAICQLGLKINRSADQGRVMFVPGIPGLFEDHQIVTVARPLDS